MVALIGGIYFNIDAVSEQSKSDFIENYKGKLTIDINDAWQQIQALKPKICEKIKNKK